VYDWDDTISRQGVCEIRLAGEEERLEIGQERNFVTVPYKNPVWDLIWKNSIETRVGWLRKIRVIPIFKLVSQVL